MEDVTINNRNIFKNKIIPPIPKNIITTKKVNGHGGLEKSIIISFRRNKYYKSFNTIKSFCDMFGISISMARKCIEGNKEGYKYKVKGYILIRSIYRWLYTKDDGIYTINKAYVIKFKDLIELTTPVGNKSPHYSFLQNR